MYRPTEHSYTMAFVQNTTITRSIHVDEDMFLSLVDFQLVMSGSLQQCFFIDVIGQFNEDEKPLALCDTRDEKPEIESLNGVQDKRDKWLLSPRRTISELTGCLEAEKNLVMCIVYAIDSDWGWYYFRLFHITSISPRFKLHLMVKDDTGEASLMLLDMVTSGLISESATELLNGSFDELEDPEYLSEAITQIVGKTFTFGIYVENEHIVYGSEIYKVGRVYKDRLECLNTDGTQTYSLSDKCVTLTSGEESILHLNDDEDNSEEMSTPSIKRKKMTTETVNMADNRDFKGKRPAEIDYGSSSKDAFKKGSRKTKAHYRKKLAMYKAQTSAIVAKHEEAVKLNRIGAKLELLDDLNEASS
ncbi:OB-fold-like protein [Raphanus sativus]|nr:OB-fold-like protein [Raphanus sativus]